MERPSMFFKNKSLIDLSKKPSTTISLEPNQSKYPAPTNAFSHNNLGKQSMKLPQIDSIFLKRAVQNLFPNGQNSVPSLRRFLSQSKIDKGANLINHDTLSKMEKMFNNKQVLSHLNNQGDMQTFKHMTLSLSLKKKPVLKLSQIDLISSEGLKSYSHRMEAGSILGDQSQRDIYNKIIELDSLPSVMTEGSIAKKDQGRAPTFVTRHKIVKELHGQEKEQVQAVKNILGDKGLKRSLKVSRYVKFDDPVMIIDPNR